MNKVLKTTTTFAIASSLLLVSVPSETHAATKPYYSYNGYVKNNSKFLIDKDFVRALKYDNFKMNGYKLNLKGRNGYGTKDFMKYDTYYYKDAKNRVTMIRPIVSHDKTITLKQFLAAHKNNKLIHKGKGPKVGVYDLHYRTNGADYFASFYKGYLIYFEYGVYAS
ncbi:immunodominant staphylococcal antigen IsaB family protein [Macrococcus equi]|uniref:immunodominant staphylococcal antigen IsaB family protein n=1 Tax=Macrococcus equi TaxID=3395462 RepID=UPI0039BE9A0B